MLDQIVSGEAGEPLLSRHHECAVDGVMKSTCREECAAGNRHPETDSFGFIDFERR